VVRRHNALLVAFYVAADAVIASAAFLLAFVVRFHSGLLPVTKGYPPLEQYIGMLPFVAALTPLAFQLQGLYRLRRGRSRTDDFFSLFIGTVMAIALTAAALLYVQTYLASPDVKSRGALEVSQPVWAIFLLFNVATAYLTREVVREVLERRWRAGIGLKRILIAGSGELGRMVAERVEQHRELGYQVVGFVDDADAGMAEVDPGFSRPADVDPGSGRSADVDPGSGRSADVGSGFSRNGKTLPVLGSLQDVGLIARREQIDHLYVALPADQHVKLLGLIELTSRECIDVKVVPDLLQFIALRARLEDLDGLPVININDVPLQGVHAWVKRGLDVTISALGLVVLSIPLAIVAALVRWSSAGPVFYTQERMGLDGKAFHVYKFRSMYVDAEECTGPVWADDDDPRATPLGRWLRRFDLDELPQLWNVLRGDMSLVGPRPERPFFVEQFKHRLPQYMLRHKVKAGITGWAQVNGWRGNTSLEKRLEYDLYYIENWSVTLDLKIIWLTVVRGLFQRGIA
jgi:Undecaprenyl-phosphate glucose phosphotransferase